MLILIIFASALIAFKEEIFEGPYSTILEVEVLVYLYIFN